MMTSTFSIAALDRATGEIGVAVASKVLAVGALVPWARAGVGGVATQAWTNIGHGPEGLRLLEEGLPADEVLKRLVASDEHRERRQVGVLDTQGRSAAWTGRKCSPWAGHRSGDGYTCQGNLLVGASVVDAMAQTFEATAGALPERLLAVLEAGQAQGGDNRGQQSAALLVVMDKGGPGGILDRYVDIRVDDATTPIVELRRLLDLHRRLRPGQKAIDEFVIAGHGDLEKVKALLERHPVLVQTRARWDETALEAAAHTAQREIAEFLLSQGASLDICTAAMLGMKDRVAAFLQADPALAHATGAHGIPVLFYPAISGQREVAELLVARGANPNARDHRGKTPLQLAVEAGRTEMADLLRQRGGAD